MVFWLNVTLLFHKLSITYRIQYDPQLIIFPINIGAEQLLQVLNKQLSLATTGSQVKDNPQAWSNMIISTLSFTKSIFTVTGKGKKSCPL